ncbi:MAG: phosphoglycerate kinase [Gammaproteobacteria bacterium]|nr:phosphoglycerate kinase [Gammaproteobacteria bacterium]
MKYKTLEDIDLHGKRILIRLDLNVPIKEGKVMSTARIDMSLLTIRKVSQAGGKVMLMSHLGRPTEGQFTKRYSLNLVADILSDCLGQNIPLIDDYLLNEPPLENGDVVLFENIRFNEGELENKESLSRQYASLCDVFVMDAFGAAHRTQSSTYGVGFFAKEVCAGPLLVAEIQALSRILKHPLRPMVSIVGGSKVSTKLVLLDNMMKRVDTLIPGGGIANTFLVASGIDVGNSVYEASLVEFSAKLIQSARELGKNILLPEDVVVADRLAADVSVAVKPVSDIGMGDMILDIGPKTCEKYRKVIQASQTIIWNGPLGVFEFEVFSQGTREIGQAIFDSNGYSVAGGGETLAAIEQNDLADGISCISTGGGAFLEFLESGTLPIFTMLEQSV